MWSDNDTDRDFLNFKLVADTAVEVIAQAPNALSLGVSGNWGVGKSSMLRLIKESLAKKKTDEAFVFVDFNAWLYQGHDDARAALLEVIARKLVEHGSQEKKDTQSAMDFLRQVPWLRYLKTAAVTAAAWKTGLAIPGAVGAVARLIGGQGSAEDVGEVAESAASSANEDGPSAEGAASPPQEIQSLRDYFEKAIEDLNVKLVVFIDDLDRCLPETTIATLEAIRLFLFLKRTAFVIAADDEMIRHCVSVHFKLKPDDRLVTNYFDKLIQVPLRVPPLGTQEVRAYLMLLFIENSTLTAAIKDDLRQKICKQLGETWLGKAVDRAFVTGLIPDCPPELLARLETADRLAPIMASSNSIQGNPRLIKRFLNTLSIRMSLARAQGITVDEADLAKMLVLERCGESGTYETFVREIVDGEEGRVPYMKSLEASVAAGKEPDPLPLNWKVDFAKEWASLPPSFADRDLRPAAYVSRERIRFITAGEQLSATAAKLLSAVLELRTPSQTLDPQLKGLSKRDLGLLMDRVLEHNKRASEWDSAPALAPSLTLAALADDLGLRMAAYLLAKPHQQIKPGIVARIGDSAWAKPVLEAWQSSKETTGPVRNAIQKNEPGSR